MALPLPVVVFGLGPIGLRIADAANRDPTLELVGAVDSAPAKVGRRLSELAEGCPDIEVHATLSEARPDHDPKDLTVLHATGSYLEQVEEQFLELITAGVHVVSTCEELAYPFARHPQISSRLDQRARAANRTIIGTGINPGFMMDQLPVSLLGATHDVKSVTVTRMQNPGRRRVPFQEKVGMGMSRADYDLKAGAGGFGHVGLVESGRLLAAGLGWEIDNWSDTLEAVQPDPAGPVLGTRQVLDGSTDDGKTVRLHFEAQRGVEEDYDETVIDGTPPLKMRFVGGVFGDDGTSAAVLRAARVIRSAPHGLITVLDLPLRVRPE